MKTRLLGIIVILIGICGFIWGLFTLITSGFSLSSLFTTIAGLLIAFAGTGLLKVKNDE